MSHYLQALAHFHNSDKKTKSYKSENHNAKQNPVLVSGYKEDHMIKKMFQEKIHIKSENSASFNYSVNPRHNRTWTQTFDIHDQSNLAQKGRDAKKPIQYQLGNPLIQQGYQEDHIDKPQQTSIPTQQSYQPSLDLTKTYTADRKIAVGKHQGRDDYYNQLQQNQEQQKTGKGIATNCQFNVLSKADDEQQRRLRKDIGNQNENHIFVGRDPILVGETTEMVWNGKKNGLKDNKYSSEHLKFNEKCAKLPERKKCELYFNDSKMDKILKIDDTQLANQIQQNQQSLRKYQPTDMQLSMQHANTKEYNITGKITQIDPKQIMSQTQQNFRRGYSDLQKRYYD